MQEIEKKELSAIAKRALQEAELRSITQQNLMMPKEINGRIGLEPTRYNDWEKKGIICDF